VTTPRIPARRRRCHLCSKIITVRKNGVLRDHFRYDVDGVWRRCPGTGT
jgi:hypothetical protein